MNTSCSWHGKNTAEQVPQLQSIILQVFKELLKHYVEQILKVWNVFISAEVFPSNNQQLKP